MSVIQFSCPECKVAIRITKPELAGKKIRCPKCKAVVQVPAASAPAAPAVKMAKPPQEVKKAAPIEKTPPRPAVVREDQPPLDPEILDDWGEMEDRPKKKGEDRITKAKDREADTKADAKGKEKKPRKRSKVWPILALIVVLAYAGWVAATLMGYIDVMELIGGKSPPTGQQGRGSSFLNGDQVGHSGLGASRNSIPEDRPGKETLTLPAPDIAEDQRGGEEREKRYLEVRAIEEQLAPQMMKTSAGKTGRSGELLYLQGHTDSVECLAFSPDGKYLASGSQDKTVHLWDLASAEPKYIFTDHEATVKCLAFSPDGGILVAGCEQGKVHLWNLKTGMRERSFQGPSEGVLDFAYSPDGRLLACCGCVKYKDTDPGQRTLFVWDLKTGEPLSSFPPAIRPVRQLRFLPKGTTLLSKEDELGLQIYDVTSGAKYRHGFRTEDIVEFAMSSDGRTLATTNGSVNEGVTLLNLSTGQLTRAGAMKGVRHFFGFSPDHSLLGVSTFDGIELWELKSGSPPTQKAIRKMFVGSGKISPGGLFLAVEKENSVSVWLISDLLDSALSSVKDELKRFGSVDSKGRFIGVNLSREGTNATLEEIAKVPMILKLRLPYFGSGITDTGLKYLKGMSNLEQLDLASSRMISDAGLVHLQGLTQLRELDLQFVPHVTDLGLSHLQGLTELRSLNLTKTSLDGAGLRHLKRLANLETLNLSEIPLGDDDLAPVAGLTKMKNLDLRKSNITDGGLAHLAKMSQLTALDLSDVTGITDAGLGHLKDKKQLERLSLSNTNIGDEGFAHLKDLTELKWLSIDGTTITDDGLQQLTNCKKLSALFIRDTQNIKGFGLAHLKNATELTALYLGSTQVTDEGLAGIKDLTQLQTLELPLTTTDLGLSHIGALTNLQYLTMHCKGIKGPGLAHLKELKQMKYLDLSRTGVSDETLASVKVLTHLEGLLLPQQITNAGLVHLKDLPGLTRLTLSNTQVTDAGLDQLHPLKQLQYLYLERTKCTPAGIQKLKAALPEITIYGP